MNLVCSNFFCEVTNCNYFAGCTECQFTLDCCQCLHCIRYADCVDSFKRAFKRDWRSWYREFGGSFNGYKQ